MFDQADRVHAPVVMLVQADRVHAPVVMLVQADIEFMHQWLC